MYFYIFVIELMSIESAASWTVSPATIFLIELVVVFATTITGKA